VAHYVFQTALRIWVNSQPVEYWSGKIELIACLLVAVSIMIGNISFCLPPSRIQMIHLEANTCMIVLFIASKSPRLDNAFFRLCFSVQSHAEPHITFNMSQTKTDMQLAVFIQ
jgi:hypothetical protein